MNVEVTRWAVAREDDLYKHVVVEYEDEGGEMQVGRWQLVKGTWRSDKCLTMRDTKKGITMHLCCGLPETPELLVEHLIPLFKQQLAARGGWWNESSGDKV